MWLRSCASSRRSVSIRGLLSWLLAGPARGHWRQPHVWSAASRDGSVRDWSDGLRRQRDGVMASWVEFAGADPEIAAVGTQLLEKHGLAYLATVRADGGPRVHPVCPFIVDGRLLVATPRTSPKARDQLRDGRYVLHMLPGENDDEFRIRGRARAVTDERERALIRERGPQFVKTGDYYFEYDIEEAASAYWEHVGQPGTYPVRRTGRSTR